jgi:hypothetical protein
LEIPLGRYGLYFSIWPPGCRDWRRLQKSKSGKEASFLQDYL